ncbi:MAG: hypothetical protein M3Q69_08680 [Acidobacteriota bacterium]|nr:hypothetical protein [Acidobacteriota bacterium]
MQIDPRFLGEWRQVDPDPAPAAIFVTFEADGRLQYRLETATVQIILLTWRVEGGLLVTEQPGGSREERSAFRFPTSTRLVLEKLGETFSYDRSGDAAGA